MRRLIFILMIALLPLRGWMGEAMATEMAAMNLIANQAINTLSTANLSIKNDASDCDLHHGAMQDDSTPNKSCSDCQACHLTGLLHTVQISKRLHITHAEPRANIAHQASADLHLAQKPPIL